MKVTYDSVQVQKAAAFIVSNNSYCKDDAQTVYDSILDYIRKYAADPDTGFVGTQGFLVQFSEEDGEVDVQVYVDPAVSDTNPFYHTETITL